MLLRVVLAVAALVASAECSPPPFPRSGRHDQTPKRSSDFSNWQTADDTDFWCWTSRGCFNIKDKWALKVINDVGTTAGESGYPRAFNRTTGRFSYIYFSNANVDARCNQKDSDLLEFPAMKDGSEFVKEHKHAYVKTPARIIYTANDGKLCGIVTHTVENENGSGDADYHVCDSIEEHACNSVLGGPRVVSGRELAEH